jgi:hypothetical protein
LSAQLVVDEGDSVDARGRTPGVGGAGMVSARRSVGRDPYRIAVHACVGLLTMSLFRTATASGPQWPSARH